MLRFASIISSSVPISVFVPPSSATGSKEHRRFGLGLGSAAAASFAYLASFASAGVVPNVWSIFNCVDARSSSPKDGHRDSLVLRDTRGVVGL